MLAAKVEASYGSFRICSGIDGRPDAGVARCGARGRRLRQGLCEKVSGARTDRVGLAKLLKQIEAGDMLIVTRLDRLARSTRDLLNILHQLAEKGAKFKSLHDPWCDTSTPQGELLVTVLAGFATFEPAGSAPRPGGCVLVAPGSSISINARKHCSDWLVAKPWSM
jgi:Resolvase, N terminal domain